MFGQRWFLIWALSSCVLVPRFASAAASVKELNSTSVRLFTQKNDLMREGQRSLQPDVRDVCP